MRVSRLYVVLTLWIALTILGSLGATVVLAQGPDFPDVSPDFWAKGWIDDLVEEEIVKGYPDGAYHPETPVTRDQMAVFIGRVLWALKKTHGIGWVMPVGGGSGGYLVFAPACREASDYRLYSGLNGVDFDLVANAPYVVGFEFVQWHVPSGVVGVADTYFKPVGVVDDQERQLTHLLVVRPSIGPLSITITSPQGASVPRVPIIEWNPVANVVAYFVMVRPVAPGLEKDYWALTEGWRTSVRFNQRFGPGVLWGYMLLRRCPEPLAGDSDYVVSVYGIDAGGYVFASGHNAFHTMP